jgi:hypothetical protein
VLQVDVSYKDAQGAWQLASTATTAELFAVDQPGDQADAPVQIKHQTSQYNSFGEVVARSQDGVQYEYSRYDQRGQAWLTNAGDGIDKVLVYNVTGQVSLQVRTPLTAPAAGGATDFKAMTSAMDVDKPHWFVHQERTLIMHDLLGRAVYQITNAGNPDHQFDNNIRNTVTNAEISILNSTGQTTAFTLLADPENLHPPVGEYTGTNSTRVDFFLPPNVASHDILVRIDYAYDGGGTIPDGNGGEVLEEPGGPQSYEQAFSPEELTVDQLGRWRATLNWAGKPFDPARTTRLQVCVKDIHGVWKLLSSVDNPPADRAIAVEQKTGGPYLHVSSAVSLSLRVKPYGDFIYPPLIDLGDVSMFDLSGVAAGDYRVQFTTRTMGTFGWSNYGEISLQVSTDALHNPLARIDTPVMHYLNDDGERLITQHSDRWGNLLSSGDGHSPEAFTYFRYNTFGQLGRHSPLRTCTCPNEATTMPWGARLPAATATATSTSNCPTATDGMHGICTPMAAWSAPGMSTCSRSIPR